MKCGSMKATWLRNSYSRYRKKFLKMLSTIQKRDLTRQVCLRIKNSSIKSRTVVLSSS